MSLHDMSLHELIDMWDALADNGFMGGATIAAWNTRAIEPKAPEGE